MPTTDNADLLSEILALGGSKEDLSLIAGTAGSDAEDGDVVEFPERQEAVSVLRRSIVGGDLV